MKYKELSNALTRHFPFLQQLVAYEMDTFECYSPGPHIIYGNVFNPYLKKLLHDESDLLALRKAFAFLEELAKSKEGEVKNLLQVTLLEALWDEKYIFDRACKYMLPLTKQINESIGNYMKMPTI